MTPPNAMGVCAVCGAPLQDDAVFEVKTLVRRRETGAVLHNLGTVLVCEACVARGDYGPIDYPHPRGGGAP